MRLTLVTCEYFLFINLIRLFIITYKIFLYRTHVNLYCFSLNSFYLTKYHDIKKAAGQTL